MRKRLPFIIATIIVTLFIFNNSIQSAEVSSQGSGIIVNTVSWFLGILGIYPDGETLVVLIRKAAHISEFLLQGILLANCFDMQYKRRVIYILFFGLLTACVDEYLQVFAVGRASLLSDVFIDFFGTVLGMMIAGISYKIRRK